MPVRSPSHAVAEEYQSARSRAALFDLSARGKVELAGKDAVAFLHNLCTNDIKNLAPGGGCEAFLTTNKARVVAHAYIARLRLRDRDVLWLDVVPGQAEKLLKHLDHFLISEQVELTDRTAELALLHLCGPEAKAILDQVLTEALSDLPELHHVPRTFTSGGSGHVRRHDALGLPGYDIFCARDDAAALRQALLSAGAAPAGPETYDVLRVEAGTPIYGVDIDDNRLVVEVGRTQQAICYTKGCYLGQEPIVMARDRGHVNRTLLGLKMLEGGVVPAGAKVFQAGQEVGQVTSSVLSPRLGSAIALAYLRRGSQEPGTAVEVETSTGQRKAQVMSLPFAGPTA